MDDAFMYLKDCVNTDIRPSNIHGVGTFALTNIRAGEPMFVKWHGDSNVFLIRKDQYNDLPTYIQRILLKSYENDLNVQDFVWFRLTQGCYFNLSNPYAYINAASRADANFESTLGIAIKDINDGDEILGTYTLKNTILEN